ncbi:MAG: hypothetical protein KKB21_04230 [Nanoarchaeota archaeon]|nr:hypothetical protein [Nanoarchaeota archaeon]
MNLHNLIQTEHKEIIFKQKGQARMILAYHTYGNGICFGGVRLLPLNAGEKAVTDALRLSEAMTYKLALINSHYGSCKAVVLSQAVEKQRSSYTISGILSKKKKVDSYQQ